MEHPVIPYDEAARLRSLNALGILDTPAEERFDRITRIAKGMFGTSMALISLVDENRQWFKSRVGLDVEETPREISFCGHAILGEGAFVVPDTLADERFCDNPLVTDDPRIRFYAGFPLALPNGSKVGTLCVIDQHPRTLSPSEVALLKDLAEMATHELVALQLATMDDLTQLSNRRGFTVLAQHALDVCRRMRKTATFLYFDLDHFKRINDRFGHSEGDIALVKFAEHLRRAFRESDVTGRLGGDEFGTLFLDSDTKGVEEALSRLREQVDEQNAVASRGYELQYSVGTISFDSSRHDDVSSLLKEADQHMYDHKQQKSSAWC